MDSSQTQTILLVNSLGYVVVSQNENLGKEILRGKEIKIEGMNFWNSLLKLYQINLCLYPKRQ